MQTKKALGILSKGDKQYEGPVGPLAEQAERFAKAYDERENRIVAAKNRDTVIQPVLDVLRRKATKVASEQDRATPVAMRFDAYQEIKVAADQTQDRGLIHLAKQLEQMWHKDPMGSITLGQLADLKAHYERNYPRSKIAVTVDKAISKVSYAKLPVAKLARLAAKIEDQSDFDHVIVTAGLDGDRPDQVKARTLIRELVAMRGAVVDGREPAEKDTRTASQRASDRIAQEMFSPPVEEPAVDGVPDGAVDDMALVDLEPAAPVDEGALEDVGGEADATDLARQVQEFTQNEVAPSLPGIEQYNEVERAENGAGPVDDPITWAFEEGREEQNGQPTHSVSPSDPGWVQEELAEHDGAGPEAGGDFGDDLPPAGPPAEPLPPMMARKASGMDAPKPKTHPKVTTYAPDRSKDGGNELTKDETKKAGIGMTAAEIETALLDRGETVKIGSVSLHVNDQDEVELWVRDAGFAAPLSALDTAIEDFMKHANEQLNPNVDTRGSFALVELVPVPCSRCASISHFEPVDDMKTGVYACDCGNRTRAATIDSLIRHGQLKMAYVLRIDLPADYVKQADVKAASEQLLEDAIVPHARQAKLDGVQGRSLEVWLPEADMATIRKVSKSLAEFGLVPVQVERMAQFAGDIKAPGSADAPVAPDVAQQNVKPGGADKGSPAIEDPSTHQDPDIASSFAHYKSMGIGFIEAIAQFKKDFPEWVENHSTPDLDAQIIQLGQQLYTGGTQAPAAVPAGTPAPSTPGAPAPAPMSAQAFKNPSVNAQQPDAVSVEKNPMGKDSDPGHPAGLKQPAVKVKHPAKQKSPTDLGSHSDDKDPGRFKAPTPPKDGHVPGKAGDQPGTKAPPTEMGKDSDGDGKKSIPVPGKFGPRP